MAITATTTVIAPGGSTTTGVINQNCTVQYAISNANATGAYLQSIVPSVVSTSSGDAATPGLFNTSVPLGVNQPVYVAPSGTLTVSISMVFPSSSSHPAIPAGTVNSDTQNRAVNSNNTYTVGGTLTFYDANTTTTLYVVAASTVTFTVNATPLPCSN